MGWPTCGRFSGPFFFLAANNPACGRNSLTSQPLAIVLILSIFSILQIDKSEVVCSTFQLRQEHRLMRGHRYSALSISVGGHEAAPEATLRAT
jgi:hypothetical protein